jgi:hypothetical protein
LSTSRRSHRRRWRIRNLISIVMSILLKITLGTQLCHHAIHLRNLGLLRLGRGWRSRRLESVMVMQKLESVLHLLSLSPRPLLLNQNIHLALTHRYEKVQELMNGRGRLVPRLSVVASHKPVRPVSQTGHTSLALIRGSSWLILLLSFAFLHHLVIPSR